MARKPRNKATRFITTLLTWVGAAVVYFVLFSLLFDTPAEYELRHSTDRMKAEYEVLSARYDSLNMVVENVIARDRNIFGILFESTPYDFNSDYEQQRLSLHEKLLEKSKHQMLRDLTMQTSNLEERLAELELTYSTLQSNLDAVGDSRNNIPSIQPVINHQLTLLTAGYGMLMHPFYRTLQSHQGVDYSIPEGESVFATADGVVKEVLGKTSTSGITVVIDHGNGLKTRYAHASALYVAKGTTVSQGEMIAGVGSTGYSTGNHLHFEVIVNGTRVNPAPYIGL